MHNAKDRIPKQCRISGTCFTILVTIGGNLYMRHPKNIKHVHKNSNDLLEVIIILVTDAHEGETVFKIECIFMILVKEHILLSIHTEGVCLMPLIKIYMKYIFGLDLDQFYLLSYTNQYFSLCTC